MNQPQEKPRLSLVQHAAGKRLRILVVGVDEAVTIALKSAFDPVRTISLEITPDTETAMRSLSVAPCDLVAVDPAVSPGGFALLKYVKDNFRWTATLLATGSQDPQFLRQAIKCRIDGLLFRPAEPTEFVEQVLLLAKGVNVRRRRQQNRVLAIGAHPDDVEIGCGGALAKHRSKGDLLHILTLSRGAAGGDVNVRVGEAEQAAELLGAKLEFGNVQDGHITEGIETIELIEAAIRELRPTHVYTHSLEDTHQDHRAVHTASLVAARGVPNVYCYQAPSSTVEFSPNRFVDITDFIKAKLTAIGVYKSQVSRSAMLQDDVILATARYWGRYAGHVLAEPMRIIRQRDGEMKPDIAAEKPVVKLVPQSTD